MGGGGGLLSSCFASLENKEVAWMGLRWLLDLLGCGVQGQLG